MRLYLAGGHEAIVRDFLGILSHYDSYTYVEMTPQLRSRVNALVANVLYFLTRPDFRIPDDLAQPLIGHQHIFANLVAMSYFGTTDPQVKLLLEQDRNFVKLLFLYSARNKFWIDPKVLFDAEPHLASVWYLMYSLCTPGGCSQLLHENLRRHVAALDPRMRVPNEAIVHLYFASTYVDPQRDRPLKTHLNRCIQQQLGEVPIVNRPQADRIAILTAKWWPGSAVYKSMAPLVRSLQGRYKLTLVHLGPPRDGIDTSMFDRVLHVTLERSVLQLGQLKTTDFQLAYYPDIGMNPESIWMSNVRVAPVQVMGYGHPVSTFGSRIDYFIGGMDSELPERAEENYSEHLVLIPGIGAHPVYPDYRATHPRRTDEGILITCSWGCSKINYPMLVNLRSVADRASRPVHFQFLPNWALQRYNTVLPFLEDLSGVLGGRATVISDRPYPEYMQRMELGDLAVDSYPFGGYNTIVDALYLHKPIVTYEGTHFYNRAASALLRKLGLEELIAHNDDEYVEKTLRLVEDDSYRNDLSDRLAAMDLKARLFDTDEPQYFRKAIDYLIENHERLQQEGSRTPIVIGRNAAPTATPMPVCSGSVQAAAPAWMAWGPMVASF